jgi:hypothetical protein
MGMNPATHQWIPFDITNKTFATNLMDIMLRPLEEEGVTFWWLGIHTTISIFFLSSS